MKRIITILVITVMVLGAGLGVYAGGNQAAIEGAMQVKLNNNNILMQDVNGYRIYPILYNGTTYLPVRSIAETLGVNVEWEDSSKTVILNSTSEEITVDIAENMGVRTLDNIKIDSGISVKLDGKTLDMKDAQGKTVYPMLYKGSTYLPLRALSGALGMDLNWNHNAWTIELTTDKAVVVNKTGVPTEIKVGNNIPSSATRLDAANKYLYSINGTDKEMRYVENEKDFEYAFKVNFLNKGTSIEIDVPPMVANKFKAEYLHVGNNNGPIYFYKNKVGGQVLFKIEPSKLRANTVYEVEIDLPDISVLGSNVDKIVIASKINLFNKVPPHGFIGHARFELDLDK